MSIRNFSFAGSVRLVRKTILQVLIGLMGGGVAVLAQQAPDAAPAAAVATVSDATPVTAAAAPDATATPAATAPMPAAEVSMPAQTDATASVPATPVQATPDQPAPAEQPAAAASAPPAEQPAPAATSAAAASATAAAKAGYYVKDKKGHLIYTGPNEVVVLTPTPMLDGEGKQRVDPDGKLMFNVPVKQIRDKKGHPEFDEKAAPVFETATNLGYTEKGKKIEPKKIKPPKMTPISISAGTLTVDGWTGKARLNYDIADLKFLYIYAPGVGTTIVSQNPFPGAKETAQAFNGKTLSITVDGHPIQLYSEKLLLGKKPTAAWVVVDRGFLLPSKFPVFGYGATTKSPYNWPGAKASVASTGVMQPPPLPTDVRPTLLLAPCPTGMMRQAGAAVLPGQKAPDRPCVPINAPASASTTPAATPNPAARQN